MSAMRKWHSTALEVLLADGAACIPCNAGMPTSHPSMWSTCNSPRNLASEMFVAGKISRAHLKKGTKKAMLVLPAYLESYLGLKYLGTVNRSTIWMIAAELLLHHHSMCTYVLWHLGLTIISKDPSLYDCYLQFSKVWTFLLWSI